MIELSDVRATTLVLDQPPQRIVSLVPSDSYTLLRFGAGDRLVGRTDYCIEPAAEVAGIEAIGGTKNPNVARIIELAPDIVIANREENRRHDVDELEAAGVPVLVCHPCDVAQGLDQAHTLARLLPSERRRSGELLAQAREQLQRLEARQPGQLPTFVPIWMSPLMTAASDTFVSAALQLAGGRNIFADAASSYPRISLEQVRAGRPRLVLLPDEPHPFSEADAEVFRELDAPDAPLQVAFCDGKDLTWYGLRCLEGLERVAAIIDAVRSHHRQPRAT